MKFAFVSEEKVAFPVAALCRLLEVSASGFYVQPGSAGVDPLAP